MGHIEQIRIWSEVACVAQHKMFRYSAKLYLIPAKTMMEDKLVWIICYDSGLSISSTTGFQTSRNSVVETSDVSLLRRPPPHHWKHQPDPPKNWGRWAWPSQPPAPALFCLDLLMCEISIATPKFQVPVCHEIWVKIPVPRLVFFCLNLWPPSQNFGRLTNNSIRSS